MNHQGSHVPEVHDGTSPLPLWVYLHGVYQDGPTHIIRLRGSADEHGFVLAAPSDSDAGHGWTWRGSDADLDTSLSNPDIALVDGMLDHLADELCLDLARVYLAGFQGGGGGASVLGCVLEDKVAAVSPSSGLLDVGEACELDHPVPFLAVHGTADEWDYFDCGLATVAGYPVLEAHAQASMPERATNVALRNGCEPAPSVDAIEDL